MRRGVTTIFVCGPTASGKSSLAMKLAQVLDGEIICADSQTVRRGMNIGTAKPSTEDQALVMHHVLDVIDPYDDFSLADFLKLARRSLDDIWARGKVAVVVGGTGLYIDALYYQFKLPDIAGEWDEVELAAMSIEELQLIIERRGLTMPKNDKNPRHLVNTVKRGKEAGGRGQALPGSIIVGISPSPEVLKSRIEARIIVMFDMGFIDEVRKILETYGEPPREFDAIGYKIAHDVIRGNMSQVEAKELFMTRDRQYAKRQMSWLKRNLDIVWYDDAEKAYEGIMES